MQSDTNALLFTADCFKLASQPQRTLLNIYLHGWKPFEKGIFSQMLARKRPGPGAGGLHHQQQG